MTQPFPNFAPIHSALIPTPGPLQGKVLVFAGATPAAPTTQLWAVIDPETRTTLHTGSFTLPAGEGNLFCSGHAWMADGRLFVAGGDYEDPVNNVYRGARLAYIYDPTAGAGGGWSQVPQPASPYLQNYRHYPTVLLLSDGKVLVAGGIINYANQNQPVYANDYEVYDPASGQWETTPSNSRFFQGPQAPLDPIDQYPRLHLLSNGQFFVASPRPKTTRCLHDANVDPPNWQTLGISPFNNYRYYGTSVLLPNINPDYQDTVMEIGGGYGLLGLATAEVEVSKASAATSGNWPTGYEWWALPTSSWLKKPRKTCNGVLTPDGSVFVFGGENDLLPPLGPTRQPERYSGGVWTLMAPEDSPRDYHSGALLLPSGKVVSLGGESRTWDFQVYQPYYLACGYPRITWATAPPQTWAYAATLQAQVNVPLGATLQRMVLMAPGSFTHHSDMHQRFVNLEVPSISSGGNPVTVTFKAPPTSSHAPRGYYQCFAVANSGTPSVVSWIQLQ